MSPANIESDLAESLATLGTDHVEVLLLHRDDESQGVGPLMETLAQLVAQGKIGGFGFSNWTTQRMQEAVNYCASQGLPTPMADSPNLSLAQLNRQRWPGCLTADEKMLGWHRQTQIPLLAWSPQAEGFFADRFQPKDIENPELAEFVEIYFNENNWQRQKELHRRKSPWLM